jgi:hypothetical protein
MVAYINMTKKKSITSKLLFKKRMWAKETAYNSGMAIVH